ncbi:hypothetical protein [Hyalangium versicolor]|uniref:hypothetical protein n=1 Tax=Hyalangium versicolor TaxID=2861190 RepID=UPI001CCE1202|nr:hypothetical protein [Hyalangium versicolor]
MSTPLPQLGRCSLLLASVFRKEGDGPVPQGLYDPTKNERLVSLGDDRASDVARMVSWHESAHAFLNASTCHGNAMIFAGALADAGQAGFQELVNRMLDVSRTTHETYATIASVSNASRGTLKANLLDSYPDYQPLLASFDESFPSSASRPIFCTIALTSCARAAMQTPIYETLRALPCAEWPDIDLGIIGLPDQRFAVLMTPSVISRAIAVMDAMLLDAGGRLAQIASPRIDAASERQIWRGTETTMMDAVSKAAFDIFAEVLGAQGCAPCFFDSQKDGAVELVAKIEAWSGDSLKTRFSMPASRQDDEEVIFVDFRREQLVVHDRPLPATFISLATHRPSVAEFFVLEAGEHRWVQLIVMPLAKARFLYAPLKGKELLDTAADGVIVALRRRWVPEGQEPQVELLLLTPQDAPSVLKSFRHINVQAVCALSVLLGTNWVRTWLLSAEVPVQRMAVLIDADPFALIAHHGARGAELHLTYLKARLDSSKDAYTEILCFAARDEPDVLYFTPCSTPFRQAVIEYTQKRFSNTHFDSNFLSPWLTALQRIIGHTLREEGRFGNGFWLDKTDESSA